MSTEITIRRAETVEDFRACQDVQRRAWGIADEGYVVPVATMVGAHHHGGLVLLACLPGGEAVGMSFAFLGRVGGRLCLYSQLTGVAPGYQDRGIGGRLKRFQRDWARGEGIGRIAWAFDPLQAGNARFNLDKLGATAGRYVDDMYGLRTDALNAGTPTDRLIAEWETHPSREPRRASEAPAGPRPSMIETSSRPDGEPEAIAVRPPPEGEREVLLEIPEDVNRLRAADPALAESWRLAVRRAFHAAFDAGFRAVGFLRGDGPGRLGGYILRRD